jgi:hypothetical protein
MINVHKDLEIVKGKDELGGIDTDGSIILKLFLGCNRLAWIQMAQGRGSWRALYRRRKIWDFFIS